MRRDFYCGATITPWKAVKTRKDPGVTPQYRMRLRRLQLKIADSDEGLAELEHSRREMMLIGRENADHTSPTVFHSGKD